MYIEARQIVKWKETKFPHPELVCALCGKKIRPESRCMSAIWRAQGGQYIQAYHGECAKIVKLWGYPNKFLSPKEAEKWAMRLSCNECKDRTRCLMYVFECEKAVSAIKLMGGTAKGDPA